MTLRRDATRHKFDYYEGQPDSIGIFSWCPTPKPTVPPTQVHVHFPIGNARVVFRFKGPGTLGRLIAALQDHYEDVWGEPAPGVPTTAELAEALQRAERKIARLAQRADDIDAARADLVDPVRVVDALSEDLDSARERYQEISARVHVLETRAREEYSDLLGDMRGMLDVLDILRQAQREAEKPNRRGASVIIESGLINAAYRALAKLDAGELPVLPLVALAGAASSPDDLRAAGWSVGVHNDYHQDGRPMTFWLVTRNGRELHGEGPTDADALDAIRAQLRKDPT